MKVWMESYDDWMKVMKLQVKSVVRLGEEKVASQKEVT